MSGPNPRAAAVAALVRQEQDGFSNLILDAELRRQKLEGRDKAFASAIFYTVLEHQGTLDYILSQFLPKGLAKLDPLADLERRVGVQRHPRPKRGCKKVNIPLRDLPKIVIARSEATRQSPAIEPD